MNAKRPTSKNAEWNVFLCYRQVDGGQTAEWLHKYLHACPLPTGEEDAPHLNVYFDQTAAAVSNWKALHQPALEKARALIVVCTPGAAMDQGPDDYVYKEIHWWMKNRKAAPILVDTTGEGDRWVPGPIRKRWPNAQRLNVDVAEWARLPEAERAVNEKRIVQRIAQGILLSESTVRDEELERKRRTQRKLVVALVLAGMAILVAGWQWWSAEKSADEAKLAKTRANRSLDEVSRLADAKKVRDLVVEAETLWPIHPDQAPAMARWMKQAQAVLKHRAGHEKTLATLRKDALPYTEEDRARDHTKDERALAQARRKIESVDEEIRKTEATQDPEKPEKLEKLVDTRAKTEVEVKRLEAALKERRTWRFTQDTDTWKHQVLTDLLLDLDRIQDQESPGRGLHAQVTARHEAAATLRKRSIEDHDKEWEATMAAIATSPKYGGLKLTRQAGLVPLGSDPDSRLFEFAHLGSGTLPTRAETTNRLVLHDDAAIVLVLIPGGTFLMGAQKQDAEKPNFDPQAETDESPVREVTLSPFFLSKYECTKGQWMAMTGGPDPSRYQAGEVNGNRVLTLRNPVGQVSWEDTVGNPGWLTRNRLVLPTEAQWEYACRAGTDTPWTSGPDLADLGQVANIADTYLKEHGGASTWPYTVEVNDGHSLHAPVGSFAANAFGLHDVHGNVYELCRDVYASGAYARGSATDPLVQDGSSYRVFRGGSWSNVARFARSAIRYRMSPRLFNTDIGFRPARSVTP